MVLKYKGFQTCPTGEDLSIPHPGEPMNSLNVSQNSNNQLKGHDSPRDVTNKVSINKDTSQRIKWIHISFSKN